MPSLFNTNRIAPIHMAHSTAPQLKLTRNYSWTVRQTERIVDRPFVAYNLHLFSVVHRAGILFSLVIYILHEINLIINTIASGWPYYILAISASSQGILSDYFQCEYTYCPYHCVIGRFSLLIYMVYCLTWKVQNNRAAPVRVQTGIPDSTPSVYEVHINSVVSPMLMTSIQMN